jgi:hypothetical protein
MTLKHQAAVGKPQVSPNLEIQQAAEIEANLEAGLEAISETSLETNLEANLEIKIEPKAEKILCPHCRRTATNGVKCQGICVADSDY